MDRYDRPPMPLLGNSKIHGNTSARYINLVLQASPAAGVPGTPQRMAAWETDEAEAQELEVLMYPLALVDGAPLVPLNSQLQTHIYIFTIGSGGTASPGGSHREYASLPMNGQYFRFRAKSLTVDVASLSTSTLFPVATFVSIYPVAGDSAHLPPLEPNTVFMSKIPKGARAFRCSPGPSENLATAAMQFYAIDGATLLQSVLFANALDWTDIPHNAFYIQSAGSGGGTALFGCTTYFRQ